MSVSSRTPDTGRSAAGAHSAAPRAGDRDPAGLLLARLSVAPTLVATAFLLVAFPLLVVGQFRPAPVIALSVVLAAIGVPLGLSRLPGLRPGAAATASGLRLWARPGDAAGTRDSRRTPWWTVVAVLVIAVGFFVFQAAYHSQFIIISRDPGSYMQFAAWIQGHGSLPIQVNVPAFGGAKGLTYTGFAMYQVGNTVVPQFMAGLPMALAVGFWLGGVNGALLLAPLFGALAVLVFAGLVARLVGARWAPLAALVIAVSEPLMFTSRSTYSETLALIVFLGGLCLVIDSLRAERDTPALASIGGPLGGLRERVARWDSARVLALLGGLGIGIAVLVRIDAPADALPIFPYLGLLVVRRQRQAVPLIIGMAIGWVWGWYDAIFVSYPYVFYSSPLGNRSSSIPMIEIVAVVIVVSVIATVWLRRRVNRTGSLPQVGEHWWLPGWLRTFAAILPFVVLAGFAARSHFQPNYVKEQYVQLTLHWVYWYLGGPAIALAAIGTAILGYGCLRGRWPAWALPLMMFCWSIVLFLYRPGITPDQPWASRRLVPMVLPGFIILSLWALAWACGKIRRGEVPWASRLAALSGSRRGLIAAGVASVCALLLLVPTAAGARGAALKRTYVGQVGAVYNLCDQIPSNASVLIIDGPLADRMSEVVRGMCNVPVARFPDNTNVYQDPAAPTALVANAIASIERTGRTPVLLAGNTTELAPFTSKGTVTHAVNLKSTMDGRYLLTKPYNITKEDLSIWMWEPTR
ncbi:MAG TPA: hypothetical protein VMG38_26200 [Trebonia sp.]|nr:hypothetical protein [Trebonia sp.]